MTRRLAFALLASATSALAASGQGLTTAMDDSVWTRALRRSNFAFCARVVSVRSTSTASVIAGRRTIVVETIDLPDSATQRPAGFRPLGARRVTVIMRDTLLPQPNATLYFFAAGLASDSGLAVREIAHAVSTPGERSFIVAKVAVAKRAIADGLLRATLKAATGVWLARVDSVHPLTQPQAAQHEHGFDESEAFVRIQRRFGGRPTPVSVVRMIVVASGRTLGGRNPSVQVGDVAIFAPSTAGAPFSRSVPVARSPYVIVTPDQVIPASDSTRVKRFMP